MALIDKLTAIGDAIREKTGTTELLTLDGMAAAIAGISTGIGGSGIIEKGTLTNAEKSTAIKIYLDTNKWNGELPQYLVMLKQRTASETVTDERDCLVAYFWECVSTSPSSSFEGDVRVEFNVTEIGYQGSNLKIPDFLYHYSRVLAKENIASGFIGNVLVNNWGMNLQAGVTYEWVAIGGLSV